jgi:mannitol-specific phosphotransferase system IIBC component
MNSKNINFLDIMIILLAVCSVVCPALVFVQMAQQASKQITEQTAEPKQTTEKASQQTAEQTAQQTSQQTNEIIYNIDISNIEIISFGAIILLLYLVISSDNPVKSLRNYMFKTYKHSVQNVPVLRRKGISEQEAIKRMRLEGMVSTAEFESKMEDLVRSNSDNYSFDTVDDLPRVNPDKKIAYVTDDNSYYYWSGTEWLEIENLSQ